jgi:transposase
MKNYIGIDISKATLDVYNGKKSYKFENDDNGFKQIVSLSEDIKNTILIFEPTGIYSYALSEFCSKKKIQVVIVGPKESRDFARSLKVRSKTDKIDAKVLYKYQSHVEPKMVKIPIVNHQAIKIQEMLNAYESIQSSKQRFKNQIESTSKLNKDLLRTLYRLIDNLDTEAQKLFNKIEVLLLKEKETKNRYDAISKIPSIGQKSALYLCAFFLKYPLANAKGITALLGLDPMIKDSGAFRGKQRISKHGGQQIRNLLYLPTLCAIQHNSRIKKFYEGLTARAKTKKLAVIAAMRKLILMAFSIFKSKEEYQPLLATI